MGAKASELEVYVANGSGDRPDDGVRGHGSAAAGLVLAPALQEPGLNFFFSPFSLLPRFLCLYLVGSIGSAPSPTAVRDHERSRDIIFSFCIMNIDDI